MRWLGTSIASLSQLQRVLVVGSNLRKDHPLFAQRIRQAARKGGALIAVTRTTLASDDWAMPIANTLHRAGRPMGAGAGRHRRRHRATSKGVAAPVAGATPPTPPRPSPQSLLGGERKAILLGNAAAHHAKASSLLALANWIGAADRRHRRLPDRSRQHRRRAAGRRAAAATAA